MNKVELCGRLTRDPEVYKSDKSSVAKFSLAVDRRFKKDGEQSADFINCVSFGKTAEFVEKYLKKGTKIIGCGRIQTGSYTNKEGNRVYTTDVVIEEVEFAESKNANNNQVAPTPSKDNFMDVAGDMDEEVPFD